MTPATRTFPATLRDVPRKAVPLAQDALALAAPSFAAYALGAGQASGGLLLAAGTAAAIGVGALYAFKQYDRPAKDDVKPPLAAAAAGLAGALPVAGAVAGWWPAIGVTPLAWAWTCLALLAIRQFAR